MDILPHAVWRYAEKEIRTAMLSAQELRSEINRILAKVREEHAKIQQNCTGLATDACKADVIAVYIENVQEIRCQLRELVGDTIATAMIAQELGTDMEPPKLPTGYRAMSLPLPLIGKNDDLWVVLADHDGPGILIYEEHFCRAFLVAEECLTMLSTLMESAQKFFDLCTAEYLNNPVHQSGLTLIRNWLNQKTES